LNASYANFTTFSELQYHNHHTSNKTCNYLIVLQNKQLLIIISAHKWHDRQTLDSTWCIAYLNSSIISSFCNQCDSSYGFSVI